MSYLLDIFNRRQPMPEVSAPQQMPAPMAMPSGGPNQPTQMPAPQPEMQTMEWNRPMAMPSGGTPIQFLNGYGQQGTSGSQPAQFRHLHQQAGIAPPNMLDQINAQRSPPPGLAAMLPGGGMAPPPGPGPGWGNAITSNAGGSTGGLWSGPAMPQNPAMDSASQMPAFQPPQPMPFNNRPMPQFGAPNFSLQGGMIGAPQPSPMNGMMKGMFGVR